MKALTVVTLLMMLPITVACADSDSKSIRQKLLKPIIDLQCQNELKASKIWQASSIFLSESQLKNAQQKVCGCVSENALNNVSNKNLLLASVDEETKNKVIHQAVVNSLKGCAKEVLK